MGTKQREVKGDRQLQAKSYLRSGGRKRRKNGSSANPQIENLESQGRRTGRLSGEGLNCPDYRPFRKKRWAVSPAERGSSSEGKTHFEEGERKDRGWQS